MKNIILTPIVIAVMLVTQQAVVAQKLSFNPDRPDQTEEVHVVSLKHFQLESGLIVNQFDTGRNAVISRTILRYGLSRRLELGVLLEQGRDRNRYLDETVQSSYPLAVRLKVVLVEKHKWLPDITLVNYLQVPVAHGENEEASKRSVSMLLAFLNELSPRFRLDYAAGFQQEAFSRDIAWQVSTSLHFDITDNFESFAGAFTQYQKHEQPFYNLNAGVAYKISDRVQIDLATGAGIFHNPENRFLTFGFAALL